MAKDIEQVWEELGVKQSHRCLSEWVTYNEQMCQLIRRIGAPAAIEMAQTWLDTIGRWAERSAAQSDGGTVSDG